MNLIQRDLVHRIKNLSTHLDEDTPSTEESAQCAGFLGLNRREIEKYSILSAILGKYDAIMRHAGQLDGPGFTGLEAECDKALASKLGAHPNSGRIFIPSEVLYRDLTVGLATAGGFLVGTSIGSFIEMLRNRSVAFRMGVQRAPGQVGSLIYAKQTGGASVTWQTNEGTSASESTPSFAQVSASPKTCVAYHELSRQLTKQTTPGAEQLFLNGLAKDVAVAADLAVLSGSGAAGQPTGIVNTAGIGGVTGTSLAYAGLVECQSDVADANGALNPLTMGYVTTPTVAALLKGRQRFTGTDSPLWRGALVEGEIEGQRAMASKQMAAATLLYGDFSAATIAEWGVLTVEVNPFQNFAAGIIGVRAMWSMDVLVVYPQAFTLSTSIT